MPLNWEEPHMPLTRQELRAPQEPDNGERHSRFPSQLAHGAPCPVEMDVRTLSLVAGGVAHECVVQITHELRNS